MERTAARSSQVSSGFVRDSRSICRACAYRQNSAGGLPALPGCCAGRSGPLAPSNGFAARRARRACLLARFSTLRLSRLGRSARGSVRAAFARVVCGGGERNRHSAPLVSHGIDYRSSNANGIRTDGERQATQRSESAASID